MAPPEVVTTRPCPLVPAFKERPILFSAPMVRALLDGTKTQTRRVCKLPRAPALLGHWEPFIFGGEGCRDSQGRPISGQMTIAHSRTGAVVGCPYGQPGDRLWVRETWSTHTCYDDVAPADLQTNSIHYWADGQIETGKGRPSIHMPRRFSRIDLEVTSVRVERLQAISVPDAIVEGVTSQDDPTRDSTAWDPVAAYRHLWDSINAASRPALPSNPDSKRYARVKAWLEKHPDTSSWEANPWVWVISFQRTRP